MYLVSSKKAFAYNLEKSVFDKKFWSGQKPDLLFGGTATTKQKWKENSVSELKYIVGTDISHLATKSK